MLIQTKRHVLCGESACALVLLCRHTSRLLWSELTAPSNSIFNVSQRCDEGRSLPTPKTMRGGTSRGHVSAARNTVCTVSTTVAFASRCIVCIRCDGMYQIIYAAPHAQTCTHKHTNRHRHDMLHRKEKRGGERATRMHSQAKHKGRGMQQKPRHAAKHLLLPRNGAKHKLRESCVKGHAASPIS